MSGPLRFGSLLYVCAALLTAAACGASVDSPPAVVEEFLDLYADAGAESPQAGAAGHATDLLTPRARSEIDRAAGPSAEALAAFLRIRTGGSLTFTLGQSHERPASARVAAALTPATGDEQPRVFHLELREEGWRIDWVDTFPIDASSPPLAVVEAFVHHVFDAAPPNGSSAADRRARELLSADTAAELIDLALIGVLGVASVPDDFTLVGGLPEGSPLVAGTPVTVTFRYKRDEVVRVFGVVEQLDGWRVDVVTSLPTPEEARQAREFGSMGRVAREFVLSSPTYRFDGREGSLNLEMATLGATSNGWLYAFRFESSYAGYGDRTGSELEQVATEHRALVTVRGDEVAEAVLDGKWDMIGQRVLD